MGRFFDWRKVGLVFAVLLISCLALSPFASALTLDNNRNWYWTSNTRIGSIASGDVDADGALEIVTGGFCNDGTRDVAQLCVWSGSNLALENVKTWYWTSSTYIHSVALGDVDGDGQVEIVTGGFYNDGTRWVAQLCVWSGSTLVLENIRTWYWTGTTFIYSVALSDVDGDGALEIVTGGSYNDGTRDVAQLCVWSGSNLALENVKTWYWNGSTVIYSVAVGDVDADGAMEIVTGGFCNDGIHSVAQLCVWSGSNLALENVKTWYWTSTTVIFSVALGDIDGDGANEIVTGGAFDGTHSVAQLCVWSGSTLDLENVKTWDLTRHTYIISVAVGDVDADGAMEIVTGGFYIDGYHYVAQLCVWSGSNLALENVKTWYWTSSTAINSVVLGNVDGINEIFTGGYYNDGTRDVAQLCVWR